MDVMDSNMPDDISTVMIQLITQVTGQYMGDEAQVMGQYMGDEAPGEAQVMGPYMGNFSLKHRRGSTSVMRYR